MTNPLIAMFEGSPVMVAREHKAQFESCLTQAASHPRMADIMAEAPMMNADDGFWPAADDWRAALRPYVVQDGILMLPVRGVLLHNFPWQLGNWATGYDYIWRAYQRGLDDPNVRAVALIIHSPGGLVAGNQVLVDRMFARRDEKPVRAFAQEAAYSGAYNIFSVATHGVVSPTGGVGSIGVMTSHIDWSKFNERMGMAYTFIFAGAHKVDGNPEEPLSEDAKQRIQARIDELYDVFVSSVARNRSMGEKAVRGTEALTFSASQAVSEGLADEIGSLDDAIAAFAAFLDNPSEENEQMTTANSAAPQAAPAAAPDPAALATATATGKTDERARIKAITGSDEAKGRDTLANHIAFNTDMSVDDAKSMLAASPKAEPAPAAAAPTAQSSPADAATATFANAMDATGTPAVGGGDGGPAGQAAANPDDHTATLALLQGAGVGRFTAPAK